MKCGQAVFVKDFYGRYAARFIAVCDGRFIMITTGVAPGNGNLLPDWRAVLRELISYTVPARLTEKIHQAESVGAGTYVGFPLTYPLSVKGLADLLEVTADDVREQLYDLAIDHDGGLS